MYGSGHVFVSSWLLDEDHGSDSVESCGRREQTMKRIMAIYDVDPFYADRFAEFANQREAMPFVAVAFTSSSRWSFCW